MVASGTDGKRKHIWTSSKQTEGKADSKERQHGIHPTNRPTARGKA